nr:hypothetical protein [Candidatus Poseidoniaceae archaeon]
MRGVFGVCSILLLSLMPGDLVEGDGLEEIAWPEGSNAYDNMVSMTQFGYRKIDTSANENNRNWIASE